MARSLRAKTPLDARQVSNMSSQSQGGGESRRFNPDQIDKRWILSVCGDDEIALATLSSHDTRPDSGIGPAKIAFIQGWKKVLQGFKEHVRRRLPRRIVRFIQDGELVRSQEQLPVGAGTEVDALSGRLTRQSGIDQTPNQASFFRGDHFVVLSPKGPDRVLGGA